MKTKLAIFILSLVALVGCTTTSDSTGGGMATVSLPQPQEGSYSTTGGWGVVTLEKVGNGYEGTYTDTWASETGDLTLVIEDGAWIGTWNEPAIDRGGELYEISVSADGSLVTGLANVTRPGGHSTFSDSPFTWQKE
jgi:hypothetical protein